MKKTYIAPAIELAYTEILSMLCSSIEGVENTGNMETSLSDDVTEDYLSRHAGSTWDIFEDDEF